MINKPSILITSIGRTGTEFFAKFFADIIPDCTSLHEPDIVQFVGVENKIMQFAQQVRRAGFQQMVLGKITGEWSLVKLSDKRFLNRINHQDAANKLNALRVDFIQKMPGTIFIESNIGYYGLMDVSSNVFRDHRIIYIVRDGRDWVRSAYNWGEIYGKKGFRGLFSHRWPTAKDVVADPFAGKWAEFSRFEQLCWTWSKLNEYALATLSKNPDAKAFHFEKIFMGENRYEYLGNLVKFATSLPGIDSKKNKNVHGWLERKIHQGSNEFPGWDQWTVDQKDQFRRICGALMEKLGYAF